MEVVTGWFSNVTKQINAAVVGNNAENEKDKETASKGENSAQNLTSENDQLPKTENNVPTVDGEQNSIHPSLEDVANKAYVGAKAFTSL